jgi:hypothetical protein
MLGYKREESSAFLRKSAQKTFAHLDDGDETDCGRG